jgi:hypothetical protein
MHAVKCPKCHSSKAIGSNRGNAALASILRPIITCIRCRRCGHKYYRLTVLVRDLPQSAALEYTGQNCLIDCGPQPVAAKKRGLTNSQDGLDLPPCLLRELLSHLRKQTAQQRADLLQVLAMVPTLDESRARSSACNTQALPA